MIKHYISYRVDHPTQAMIKHYVGMTVESVKMLDLDRLGMNFSVKHKGQVCAHRV